MAIEMPHWPKPFDNKSNNFELDRVIALLDKLGNPQGKLPPVIHVGGTNGKGSTIAFLRAILESAGYLVHAYTSPKLVYFNEAIVLAGTQISDSMVYSVMEECRIVAAENNIKVTLFEATTVAAFLTFSRIKADFTLLEVGLGGRLDATNVLEKALMNILTVIDYDHIEFLGNSICTITAEKMEIIRENGLCIIGKQYREEVWQVLEPYIIRKRISVYREGKEWGCYTAANNIVFSSNDEEITLPHPNLPGKHQIDNAGNAIAAATLLYTKFGYNIGYEDLCSGLKNAQWPARLEKITTGELVDIAPENCDIYLDGAHNNSGANALKEWINEQKCKVYLIVGMTQGRDAQSFLQNFKGSIAGLYTTCVHCEARSRTGNAIANNAIKIGMKAKPFRSIFHAVEDISRLALKDEKICILICGSLFLAGDVRAKYIEMM